MEKGQEMRSLIDFMYRLSRYCYSHLLATDARHQLNKKGGHSSEEDRQCILLRMRFFVNFGESYIFSLVLEHETITIFAI